MSYTYRPLDKVFPKRSKVFEFHPGKVPMPIEFSNIGREILEAEVRKDDVWLLGYFGVGLTWLQEIVWLIGNNLDFKTAKSVFQQLRAPRIEQSAFTNEIFGNIVEDMSVEYTRKLRSPRYLRSNLPYDLLPRELSTVKPKIIYSTRNPKDVWYTFYRFAKIIHAYDEPPEVSAKTFSEGRMPMGCLIDHVLPFWNMRNEPNILFLEHEDMKRDTKKGIKIVADFLEKPLNSTQIDQICEFVSVENIKQVGAINMEYFIKKIVGAGKAYSFLDDDLVGVSKNQITPEISKMLDDWIESKTKGTDFKFKYD